jgi:hypothetical protein
MRNCAFGTGLSSSRSKVPLVGWRQQRRAGSARSSMPMVVTLEQADVSA